MLPYKLMIEGRVSIFCALSKKGVLANVTVTNGVQIRVNGCNVTDEAIYLMPKTGQSGWGSSKWKKIWNRSDRKNQ